MASQNEGYWARSKALVMRDKGWYKPLLVLSAVNLVPILGQFGASGYALEWGRLTAWGVDSAPKQKNVDVGGCIKSGARAFVVSLGYGLILAMARLLIEKVLGDTLAPILAIPLSLAVGMIISVATLRATIYQSIAAGYQVERIADMIKRDYKGLLRVLGMVLVLSLVVGIAASVLISGVMLANIGTIVDDVIAIERYGYADDWVVVSTVLRWVGSMLPALFVVFYFVGVATSFVNLIQTAAVALWMRQFDVASWGESSDPLPTVGPDGVQAAGANVGYPSAEPQDAWSDLNGVTPQSVSPDVQQMANDVWSAQAAQPIPQPVEPAQPTSQSEPATPVSEVPEQGTPIILPMPIEYEATDAQAPEPAPEPAPADAPTVHDEVVSHVQRFSWDPVPEPEPVAPQPETPAEDITPSVKTFSLADAVAQSREIINEPLPYAIYPGTGKKAADAVAPKAPTQVPFYEEDAVVEDEEDQYLDSYEEDSQPDRDEHTASDDRIVGVRELTSFAPVEESETDADPDPDPDEPEVIDDETQDNTDPEA